MKSIPHRRTTLRKSTHQQRRLGTPNDNATENTLDVLARAFKKFEFTIGIDVNGSNDQATTIAKAFTDKGSKLISVGDDLFGNRVHHCVKNRDNIHFMTEMATEQVYISKRLNEQICFNESQMFKIIKDAEFKKAILDDYAAKARALLQSETVKFNSILEANVAVINAECQVKSAVVNAEDQAKLACINAEYQLKLAERKAILDKKLARTRYTANNIINFAAIDSASLDRMVQNMKDRANVNRADKYLVLLNLIYSCIRLASSCGSAYDGPEKDKLVETLRLDYDYVNKMKEHFANKEYDVIVPRPRMEGEAGFF